MIFQKGDIAKIDGKLNEIVVADEQYAVACPMKANHVDFLHAAIYSNSESFKDIIKYEIVKRREDI